MFDVYVTGIRPEKHAEINVVRANIGKLLKFSDDKVERLLFPGDAPIRIQSNLSENGALSLCSKLKELGLDCYHEASQQSRWGELSIVPIENEDPNVFTCPSCKKQSPLLKNGSEPKLCPVCKVDIELFRAEQKKKEEYEEMREKLLRRKQIEESLLEQERNKEIAQKQKEQMEAQLAKELGLRKTPWQKTTIFLRKYKVPLVAAGTLMALTVGGLVLYKHLPGNDATDALVDQIPDGDNQAVTEVAQSPETETLTKADIMALNPSPSQIAVRKGRADTARLRQKMGVIQGKPAGTTKEATEPMIRAFLDSIYQDVYNDTEWDAFLNKQARAMIQTGRLKSAYLLNQRQTEMGDHIAVLAELIQRFSKLGLSEQTVSALDNVNKRIAELPEEQQVQAKAQLGSALQAIGRQSGLLSEAETSVTKIKDPLKQSAALVKIAVGEKQIGNNPGADTFFFQAESQLKQANLSYEQFKDYIALANDYTKLGLKYNTELTLNQAEIVLNTVDAGKQDEGYSLLLAVAYELNNQPLIDKFTSKIIMPAYLANAGYRTIQQRLKQGSAADNSAVLSKISEPNYLALASMMAALLQTDEIQKSSLTTAAQQQLLLVTETENNVVTAARVARLLARLGHDQEATTLFDQSLETLKNLTDPQKKDAALVILATDAARSFLFDRAEKFAGLIQDGDLKQTAKDILENCQEIKSLL